jgi:hypothetical protein
MAEDGAEAALACRRDMETAAAAERISGQGDWSMKSALTRWLFSIVLVCLPLVALMGCDDGGEHGGDFNTDSILSIIYAVGDVVLAIIESVT